MVLQKVLFLRKRCLIWVCFLALHSLCWKVCNLNKTVCPPSDHFSDYMQTWLLGKESHQLQKLANQSICMQVAAVDKRKSGGKCSTVCYVVCYTLRKKKIQEDRKKKKN